MERKPRVVISQSIPDLIVQCDNVWSTIDAANFAILPDMQQKVIDWHTNRQNAGSVLQGMETEISNLKGQLKAKVLNRDAYAATIRSELRAVRDAIFVYEAPLYENIGLYGFDYFVGPEAGDPPAEPFEPV